MISVLTGHLIFVLIQKMKE